MLKVGKLWDSFVERRREGVFGDKFSGLDKALSGRYQRRDLCFVFGLQVSQLFSSLILILMMMNCEQSFYSKVGVIPIMVVYEYC